MKFSTTASLLLFLFINGLLSCGPSRQDDKKNQDQEVQSEKSITTLKPTVIFDSDTNNELDDQHALAYLLFNGDNFELAGVTVNATKSGGDIESQVAEAARVMRLCGFEGELPLYKGANGAFPSIRKNIHEPAFDGDAAVNFIIEQAKKPHTPKLIVIAVGKLTNLALALEKDPSIAPAIRLVWLGSNYPAPGEYNQDNDTSSVNYVLRSRVEFEMVTVRYGTGTGTDAVKITKDEINREVKGKGPVIKTPVTGRHGGTFTTFGDYSVNLFDHIHYDGNPPARALFDMAAVAIVKNPGWATGIVIPAPVLINNTWVAQPKNTRSIKVWGDFDRDKIIKDFLASIEHYKLIDVRK